MIWRGTREGETWLWRIFKKKTNAETADVRFAKTRMRETSFWVSVWLSLGVDVNID
jgi:hypothetical protein